MATITSLINVFNTTAGTHTAVGTTATNDLIIIVCANSGMTTAPTVTDNNGGGGTYTQIVTAAKDTNLDNVFLFVRNTLTVASSTTFSVTGATSTGGGFSVLKITGSGFAGTAAIKQSSFQSNRAGATTPAPVFSSIPDTLNAVIGAVFNDATTSGTVITQRTGYTEAADLAYTTPSTGLEVMFRNSGETSATITWGGASATANCSIIVELNGVNRTTKSGDWSDTTVWSMGVLPTNETAIIEASHNIVFNVDQSANTGLLGLTITGSLVASTTAGTYYLKMNGNISGAGYLSAGTSSVPYPTDCKFTIFFNSTTSRQINLTTANAINLYCAQPTTRYVSLTAAASAGATVLSVDTDISGETNFWKNTAIVRVDDINAYDSEERIISSVTSNSITITAGLTNAKIAGAIITLISRNIIILGSNGGTTNGTDYAFEASSGGKIRAEIRAFSLVFHNTVNLDFFGTISKCYNVCSQILVTGGEGIIDKSYCQAHIYIYSSSYWRFINITDSVLCSGYSCFSSARYVNVSNTIIIGSSVAAFYTTGDIIATNIKVWGTISIFNGNYSTGAQYGTNTITGLECKYVKYLINDSSSNTLNNVTLYNPASFGTYIVTTTSGNSFGNYINTLTTGSIAGTIDDYVLVGGVARDNAFENITINRCKNVILGISSLSVPYGNSISNSTFTSWGTQQSSWSTTWWTYDNWPVSLCGNTYLYNCTFNDFSPNFSAISDIFMVNCNFSRGLSIGQIGGFANAGMLRMYVKNSTVTGFNFTTKSYSKKTSFIWEDVTGSNLDYRSSMYGGSVTTVSTNNPTGFTRNYKHTLSNNNNPVFWDKDIYVPAGTTLQFKAYFKKDALMTYLPRVWVFKQNFDPFIDPTCILLEQQMTDSTNTWEEYTCNFTNSGTYGETYTVRFLAKNSASSTNAYTDLAIVSGGAPASGGGVSKSRLMGGI